MSYMPGTDVHGRYFGGLNNVLTATRIDDLEPVMDGFEAVAMSADSAMISVLAGDLNTSGSLATV